MSGDADTSGVRCSVPTCARSIEQLRAQTEYVERLRESLGISQRALIRSRVEVAALTARVEQADARLGRLPGLASVLSAAAISAYASFCVAGIHRTLSALLADLLKRATRAAQSADPEVSRLRRELAAAEERVTNAVRALIGGES